MGTKLNPEEVKKLNTGKCPDCGGQLLKGPRGGLAMNVESLSTMDFIVDNFKQRDDSSD